MRSKLALKNVISNFIFNIIIAIIGFVKIKVFLSGLSQDIYSLHQLFYQLFAYFTIADIGFGFIINKNLYKAFSKKDKKQIKEIFITSKKFYNALGVIILLASVVVSFFVKYLTKAEVSVPYMQLMFILVISLNVIDYFFEAPKGIISADEKLYEVNHLIKGTKLLTSIIQIIMVIMKIDYIYLMLASIVITLIVNIYINNIIYKKYPYIIQNKSDEDIKFNKKYLKGTRDLIPTKLAGLLNSNTDIILISKFINPLTVNIYSSYNYIIKFVTDTTYIIAAAIVPSYAAVINQNDKDKSFNIFEELNALFLFAACFVSIMFYLFLNPLINLWIGEEYLVSKTTLMLFVILGFQIISKRGIDIMINSKGYFKETKMPIFFEAIINFVLSLILVKPLGINGVLLGSVVASLITTSIFHPKFIYEKVYKTKPYKFYIRWILTLAIFVLISLGFSYIIPEIKTIGSFILYVLLFAIIILGIIFGIFYGMFKSMRRLVDRGKMLVIDFIKKKKIKKA